MKNLDVSLEIIKFIDEINKINQQRHSEIDMNHISIEENKKYFAFDSTRFFYFIKDVHYQLEAYTYIKQRKVYID